MYLVRNWLFAGGIAVVLAAAAVDGYAGSLPDTITLDSLAKLYGKVSFNHAAHIRLAKDCGVCHHHTTGTLVADANCVRCHSNSNGTKVVACRGCHAENPFSAEAMRQREQDTLRYHQDKPGLKGAYHLSCRGCHVAQGGPTDCKGCHERTPEGDAFYRAARFAPKQSPETKSHH